jgi:hypothetical protein
MMTEEKKRAARAEYRRRQYARLALLPGEPIGTSKESPRWHASLTTLEQAARVLGITRQAAHQCERRALAKIRAAMRSWRRLQEI